METPGVEKTMVLLALILVNNDFKNGALIKSVNGCVAFNQMFCATYIIP